MINTNRVAMLEIRLLLALGIVSLCSVDAQIYTNCGDSPCQHGKCIDLYEKTGYQCECEDGWEGDICDQSKKSKTFKKIP